MAGTAEIEARAALRRRGGPVVAVLAVSVLALLVPRWLDRDAVRLASHATTITDVPVGAAVHVGVLTPQPISPAAARVLVEPTLTAAAGVAVCERHDHAAMLGSGLGTDLREYCRTVTPVHGQSVDGATSYLIVTIVPTTAGRGRILLEIDGAEDLLVAEIEVS